MFKLISNVINIINYYSYQLHHSTLPDKRSLSQGMCLYQVMMTLHFLNDVAYDAESTQNKKYVIFAKFKGEITW